MIQPPNGFIALTPKVARLTGQAYEYLGEAPPANAISWQPSLLDEAKDVTESLRGVAHSVDNEGNRNKKEYQ